MYVPVLWYNNFIFAYLPYDVCMSSLSLSFLALLQYENLQLMDRFSLIQTPVLINGLIAFSVSGRADAYRYVDSLPAGLGGMNPTISYVR